MAKLSGVKTLDMVNGEITKVEYGGELYKKVAGQAQVGDLALRVKGNQFEISVGSFYLVERIRGIDEVMVNDDADDLSYRYTSKFDIFRKVSADRPPTSEYVLVTDREPKAGDFVKFSDPDNSDLTIGKYYEITEVDSAGDPQIIDDAGDEYDTYDEEFEVYEKVSEAKPKVEYREVKREAKVGELIKIVNEFLPYGYKNGDIRKVVSVNSETQSTHASVSIEPNQAKVLTKEYVVLEPVTTTTTLTHNGAEYTLVNRKAQPGDVVIIGESGESFFFKSGKPYEVVDEIVDDSIAAIGDDGVSYGLYVENFNRTPANVKVYAPVAPKLQVGDFVKVVSAGQFGGVDVGEYGKVVNGKGGPDEYRVDKLDRSDHDYFYAENLVKVTEEEATKQLLKVGDYCKTLTESRYGRVAKGVVGEITRVHHDGDFTLTPMNVSYNGIFTDKELVRATDEEVAEAKRQAEEKAAAARWAAIGRKPNEFKKGDIVRLNRDSGANDEGEIVEIATDGAHSYFDESGDRYAGAPHWFELITPVEQRFDLADGADA